MASCVFPNMASLYLKLINQGKAEGLAEGETKGKAEGKAEAVLEVLQSRFKSVPKNIQSRIRSYTDLTALRSLLVSAATCQTINEFKENLAR
jgi:flagellar biosynthesis/type III secretory pathway protein FliH